MNLVLYWALYSVAVVVPFWQLLPRYGLPRWGALLAVFPLIAVLLLWLIAFNDKINLGGK